MRLAFLCGGLEPGRDGVGDYTRILAAECVRRGHEVKVISLNDRSGAESGLQESEGTPVPCERLSAARPWSERFEAARRALEAFAPDAVSLQFVPYGFQPKGIPWRLARGLERVIAGRPLELMFHELWIGFGEGGPLRERLVGALQRRCIFGLIRRLRPCVVHTSNATYLRLLREGGVEARELPIFSNIPVVPSPGGAAPLADAGVPSDPALRDRWLVGLFFGTIHAEWEPEALLGPLFDFARREGKRVCLVSAGRLGAAGEATWSRMRTAHADAALWVRRGELPAPEISALMQAADFGVAVSPWLLMGKSGSTAAMVDHGLPIVFTRTEGAPDRDGPVYYRCGPGLGFPKGLARRETGRSLGEICAGFLASITLAAF